MSENTAASLKHLDARCQNALTYCQYQDNELLKGGIVRGGKQEFGGITWLDFNREFEDGLPMPQIVGHTQSQTYGIGRYQGRSVCLDGYRSTYGLLAADGTLEVKTTGE